MRKSSEEEARREGLDISEVIGGTLKLFGLEIDLGRLLSSAQRAGELGATLEGLREALKQAGGREVLSDEEWRAGGMSVGGHVRTRGILGDREFEIGVTERKTRRKAAPARPAEIEVREPFVDIFYEEDGEHVSVVAELPGVGEEDMEITAAGNKVTVTAQGPGRRYHKEVELDYPVKAKFETSYRNGVLEIRLARQR